MLRLRKWIVPVAGMALLLGLGQSVVRADDAAPAGKAKITVTVVDEKGTAIAGAPVILVKAVKKDKSAAADPAAKPTPLAQGVTDKDGKASFPDIADGNYSVSAKVKSLGTGKSKVAVKDGADAEATITLALKKAATPAPATPAPPADAK